MRWSPAYLWNLYRYPTKQLVESLRIKIQVLEAEVARLRGTESTEEADPSSYSGISAGSSVAIQHHSSTSISSSLEDDSISESTIPAGSVNSPSPAAEVIENSPPARSMSTPGTQFNATVMYKYISQIDESVPTNDQPTDIRLSLVCEWDRHLPQIEGIEFSRSEHDIILSRSFKYGTSWLLGLVPELFLHDMLYALSSPPIGAHPNSPARLQHYSPMLHCAILAFGCAFSDNEAIRSPQTRDNFATHAKQWLDEEFGQPSMSLIRALTILGDYHCAMGQRGMGYMYMGMGIRAARAIVSTDPKDVWSGRGIANYPDSVTREWHYWSTFAQARTQALDFDRPADMPVPRFGINLPSVDSELDAQPWPADPSDKATESRYQPKITTLVFLESCKLLVIGTRIVEATYVSGEDSSSDGVALSLHLQLDTWFNNLPERLLVWARSSNPLPYVIVLHICYWWLLIYLHRPFYNRNQGSEASIPTANLSVKMCDRGAHKIVQLLRMFGEQYDLRYFPRNMLPAITACADALMLEMKSAPPGAAKKRSTANEGVEICIRTLRTLAPTWPCAESLAEQLDARLGELCPGSHSNSDKMHVDKPQSPSSTAIPSAPGL
ncbi:Fungal specific transcription factor domain [Ceratobasidium sp. AG-Ba]|nr:Fungal specific transcription factor domain [Ceratobasidium sp. AG-Ba]